METIIFNTNNLYLQKPNFVAVASHLKIDDDDNDIIDSTTFMHTTHTLKTKLWIDERRREDTGKKTIIDSSICVFSNRAHKHQR